LLKITVIFPFFVGSPAADRITNGEKPQSRTSNLECNTSMAAACAVLQRGNFRKEAWLTIVPLKIHTSFSDGITGKNDKMVEFKDVLDCAKRCVIKKKKMNELDSCGRCMLASKKSGWGAYGSKYMDCAGACHSPFGKLPASPGFLIFIRFSIQLKGRFVKLDFLITHYP
jgi:hypothetical protein